MKIMMTRKMLLGLLLFVIAIFAVASVSAYIVDSPRMYDKVIDGFSVWPNPAGNTVAKSSNGTLYAMTAEPKDTDYQYEEYMRLYSSPDGYNWTHIHNFTGYVKNTCMAINSSGVLHILTQESNNHLSYIAFNLTTLTNITYWEDCITPVSAGFSPRMEINSTDGIRAVYTNVSAEGIYFLNDTTFDYMAIPGTSHMKGAAITIAENDSMYFGGYNGVAGEVKFWCWDDENGTLIDLGSVVVDASDIVTCSDIFVNNTTIAAIAWKSGGNLKLIYSDLPAISWTAEDRLLSTRWFFHMNGSRLEMTGPTESGLNPKYWNTSYYTGSAWTEIRNVTLVDPDEESGISAPYFSIRRNRFHEPDFWSSTVDMKFYVNLDLLYVGWEAWGQLYPNAAPSFLNLTVDTTYNEIYLVNIDPKELNPQDNVTSVLQDMNAEDDWLDYTGGVLSGTVGETGYNNTTVWVRISFDDGIVNFTYNFTFNSERVHLLLTFTLPDGYLNIHYRGTISTANNTTWYALTNAGWASVDNTTGEITGYPLSRGSFWFHIYVNDTNSNNTDDRNFTVVIGISPGDTPSMISEIVTPMVIAIVGLVLVVTILFGVLRSMGSTFNRFGKS